MTREEQIARVVSLMETEASILTHEEQVFVPRRVLESLFTLTLVVEDRSEDETAATEWAYDALTKGK